jgi:hypothetical protein
MRRTKRFLSAASILLAVSALVWGAFGQDEGFEIIYEGYVDEEETNRARLDITLYGTAGFAGAGAFWASGGGRGTFSIEGFEVHVDASAGTDGITVQGGTTTEIAGFGVAGDVVWSPGSTTVFNLRGWGSIADFQLTANVRLAGGNTTANVGAGTEFEGFGLSANLGIGGDGINQASVGANLQLGEATVSGSAGLTAGRFSAGAGLGLALGPVNMTASAGYDAELGLNAMAGGGLALGGFQATAIGLFDNTGIGGEVVGEVGLGSMTATFMGRFAGSSLSIEVGGRLPLGKTLVSASVAFDTQGGLAWAEVGFEMSL